MEHKVYKIEHLDTGMKYIGYTSGTLAQRWYQHYNDPHSAVYQALRSEGHRMTMELMAAFDSKEHALGKESELIHVLNTMHPNGWNRKVGKQAKQPPRYKRVTVSAGIDGSYINCPVCACGNVHLHHTGTTTDNDSVYIAIWCEDCHHDDREVKPPPYTLHIEDDNGCISFWMHAWVEDAS